MAIKHVGRLSKNKRKVIVAYRVVPGEPDNCLLVTTENLMSEEHDSLMKLVESDAGQSSYELAEAMARTRLPDGRNMLSGFHATGKLLKVATKDVEMTPDIKSSVNLAELNKIIAEQKGVTVADLALKGEGPVAKEVTPQPAANAYLEEAVSVSEEVITDEVLAAKYRSDADRLSKEAAALRRQADELVPTKRKSTKTVASA
jgi:hypothetical protein